MNSKIIWIILLVSGLCTLAGQVSGFGFMHTAGAPRDTTHGRVAAGKADDDSDGVPDSLDLCPKTPQTIIVDSAGCPDTGRVLTKRVLTGLFPPGGTDLRYADPTQLDSIAVFLKFFNTVSAVIYGHTDNIGIDERNLVVSQERADAVQQYFVAKGVNEDRLLSVGKGETEPIASNKTRAGRRSNRRIEIEFRH